jgi:LacI family transcriptional regulator
MTPMTGRAGITLHDVARVAGVSSRTVSRVVNGEGGFSDATRDRVAGVIQQLGYRPNLLARALITKRSGTIGLVAVDITDPFFAELADGVQRSARDFGKTMFYATSDNDFDRQNEIFETMWSHAVDGLIVFTAAGSQDHVLEYASRGLPIVVIDQEMTGPGIGSICSDIFGGAVLAVNHLVEVGRRNIAMAANAHSAASLIPPRREAGFRSTLVEHGLIGHIAYDAPTIEGGRRAVAELLADHPDTDGIFAYNDMMALGAMQAIDAAGRRIPDDIAVVGFDDVAICEALVPSLTSVRIDRTRLSKEAVAFVQRLVEQPDMTHPPIKLDVELIRRAST